jgi:hypothetical protein
LRVTFVFFFLPFHPPPFCFPLPLHSAVIDFARSLRIKKLVSVVLDVGPAPSLSMIALGRTIHVKRSCLHSSRSSCPFYLSLPSLAALRPPFPFLTSALPSFTLAKAFILSWEID